MSSSLRGAIHHKRWNDPVTAEDGTRVLVCRYRPRGVRKEAAPWDEWWPTLGPSPTLHAAAYGKAGPPLAWETYRQRYLAEIASQQYLLGGLRARVRQGETLTLLCSSACTDPARCHRTLLRDLLQVEES